MPGRRKAPRHHDAGPAHPLNHRSTTTAAGCQTTTTDHGPLALRLCPLAPLDTGRATHEPPPLLAVPPPRLGSFARSRSMSKASWLQTAPPAPAIMAPEIELASMYQTYWTLPHAVLSPSSSPVPRPSIPKKALCLVHCPRLPRNEQPQSVHEPPGGTQLLARNGRGSKPAPAMLALLRAQGLSCASDLPRESLYLASSSARAWVWDGPRACEPKGLMAKKGDRSGCLGLSPLLSPHTQSKQAAFIIIISPSTTKRPSHKTNLVPVPGAPACLTTSLCLRAGANRGFCWNLVIPERRSLP